MGVAALPHTRPPENCHLSTNNEILCTILHMTVLNFLAPDQMYPLIGNFRAEPDNFSVALATAITNIKRLKGNGSQSWYIGFCDNLVPVSSLFSSYSTLVSVYTQFYLYLF